MRLIFLNRFYWPDEPATAQLLTDLAESLAAHGHDVTVITSRPPDRHVPGDETHRGVRIVRVGSTRSRGNSVAAKALDFATFHGAMLRRLFRIARGRDTVIAMTDPPMLGLSAAVVCELRDARLVHWAQDIYPELAIELSGQTWLRALTPLRNWAWRAADACVTLGADMAGVLAREGVSPEKIFVVPNWAPADLGPVPDAAHEALRAAWQLEKKFVVAYSGNLGRVHDLDPVLDVAEALRGEPDIAFLFVGSGAQRAALEAATRQRGLPNVHFRPPQPRAQLAPSLAVGDVHLVTVRPGCERYVFPSKLYGIAAVGRPVIFLGPRDCELHRLVRERAFGGGFERTEIAAIAAEVRALAADRARGTRLGARAAHFARESGGLAVATAHWHALLLGAQACDATREAVSSRPT